jgi:hypothetical protein
MIFDVEKGDIGLVRDANGDVIFSPISGDTDTGRVLAYARGAEELVREICIYQAPLTVSPLGQFKQSSYKGPWATPLYREPVRAEITVMSEQAPRNNAGNEIVLGPAQMCDLPSSREVSILYRNWKGEVAWRRIVPLSISFESSQWHPVPQWIMRALDIDKEVERSFAIADIQNWKPSSVKSSSLSPHSG